ncbi:UNVERIFIED_CONTAM: hypothetical protein PYX00_000900 [Menopon gallinae]|uniref:Coilin N-terminal domain-containing protein n=1 Tax=Menopon gallinae TaxID=328185 RepID=A0AAW2IC13_9NEOP
MAELFTVKVDLSDLRESYSRQQLYILLVDPSKIQRVHEFQSWVRFLFSIECNVHLVYDDAIIHDLEDIRILSVLKTVRIRRSDSSDGETELQQRLTELNEFKEWHENRSPRILAEKSGSVPVKRLLKLEYSDTANKNLNTGGSAPSCSKNESQFCSKVQKCNSEKGNSENSSEEGNSQKDFKQANCIPSPDRVNECKSTVDITPNINTSTPKTPPVNANRRENKPEFKQKKNYVKPFSMYDVLNFIRSESSSQYTPEDEMKFIKDSMENSLSQKVNGKPSGGNEHAEDDEDSNLQKKQRKRIRKHKSKKKTEEASFGNESATSKTFNLSTSRESFGSKPKHIRFDPDKDCIENNLCSESNQPNGETKKHFQNEDFEMECSSGFVDNEAENLTIEKLQDIINKKRITLTSLNKNGSLNSVTIENPENYFQTSEPENVTDSIGNSYNITHVLSNIRKNNSNPLVFDRFS